MNTLKSSPTSELSCWDAIRRDQSQNLCDAENTGAMHDHVG